MKGLFDESMKRLNNNDSLTPFNMAFGKDWMFIVLRKNECTFGNVSMNTLGCLGSVLASNKELFDLIKSKTTEEIMKSILIQNY